MGVNEHIGGGGSAIIEKDNGFMKPIEGDITYGRPINYIPIY